MFLYYNSNTIYQKKLNIIKINDKTLQKIKTLPFSKKIL